MKKVGFTILFHLMIVLLLPSSSSSSSNQLQSEAQQLLQFKQALTIDSSLQLQNWDPNSSISSLCSSWTGVSCDPTLQHIATLSLSSLDLAGSISSSLGLLPFLSSLDLSHNLLSGPIPPSLFFNATHLSNLTLSYNYLSGPIPSSISNCSSLVYLDLQYNFLNHTLPPSLALLPRLQIANFAFNRLHGPIPSFSNSTHLVHLDLQGNSFQGRLPACLCGDQSNLQLLDLSYNQLTGAIPASLLLNCTQIRVLGLEGNSFVGSIPQDISKMWRLQELWMSNNSLSGRIPDGIGNLSHLQVLQLSMNNISGWLPETLGRLANLTVLVDVSSNSLFGTLPIELSNLTGLQTLRLGGNLFTASIPMQYGLMNSLTDLEMNDNMLSGVIPGHLFANRSSRLVQVLLQNNRLRSHIPKEIGHLSQLRVLYLHGNQLTGSIPESLCNCTGLQDLSLGNNQLTGSIPPAVAGLRSVMYGFSIPSNLLTGTIPEELGGMAGVNRVDLSGNGLTGSIPESLGGCAALQSLILSHNNLQGRIPESLSNLQALTVLDMSGNRLSGGIPMGLAFLHVLSYFDVSDNKLAGPIPEYGPFRNFTAKSFLNNSGLCGTILARVCRGAPAAAPYPPPGRSHSEEILKKMGITVSVVVATAVAILAVLLLVIFFRIRRRNAPIEPPESPLNVSSLDLSNIGMKVKLTPKDVLIATHRFSHGNCIGIGGSSIVYKGTMPNGKPIAVKRLKMDVQYPTDAQRSFLAELWMLGKARHRNLVQVLGYCSNPEWKVLILELMPNGSLERRLHEGLVSNWQEILRIAQGVAEGLVYLHNECVEPILHCDLKPSNILFDGEMEPHVGDFGLARVLELSTRSSKGYMAPERVSGRKPTAKGDVYSFGVILMEMVTRRILVIQGGEEEEEKETITKSNSGGCSSDSMVKSVRSALASEKPLKVVDIAVLKSACVEEPPATRLVVEMLQIASMCTQDKQDHRPTMKQVKELLLKIKSQVVMCSKKVSQYSSRRLLGTHPMEQEQQQVSANSSARWPINVDGELESSSSVCYSQELMCR